MNYRILIATALLAFISACGPKPDMEMIKRQWAQSESSKPINVIDDRRITVERIGVFRDDLAYSDRRGVYIIRDSKTGMEFIGISGIGISEVGSHLSGKTTVQDER